MMKGVTPHSEPEEWGVRTDALSAQGQRRGRNRLMKKSTNKEGTLESWRVWSDVVGLEPGCYSPPSPSSSLSSPLQYCCRHHPHRSCGCRRCFCHGCHCLLPPVWLSLSCGSSECRSSTEIGGDCVKGCYVYLMYDDIHHNNQGAFALTWSMKHCKDEFKFNLRGTRVKSKTGKLYILKPKELQCTSGPYIPKCSPNWDRWNI